MQEIINSQIFSFEEKFKKNEESYLKCMNFPLNFKEKV